MTSKKKSDAEPQLDPHITLLQTLEDFLVWAMYTADRKPSNPKAWEAIERIDANRRQLQRSLGMEVTQVEGPHGRLNQDDQDKGEG